MEQAPNLLMDGPTDRVLNGAQQKVHVFSVIGLEHADVVWGVDKAVAAHFPVELSIHIFTADSIEEISEDLFVLSFHLHFIDLGDEQSVTITVLCGRRKPRKLQKWR